MSAYGFHVSERRVVHDAGGVWHLVGVAEGKVTGQRSFTHVHCRRPNGECIDLIIRENEPSDDASLVAAISAQKQLVARLARIFSPYLEPQRQDRQFAELAKSLGAAAEGRHQMSDVDRIHRERQHILENSDAGTHAAVSTWLSALTPPFPTGWMKLISDSDPS